MDKLLSSHKTECYSAIKRDEVLIHTATGINPENIMLSEVSQQRPRIV